MSVMTCKTAKLPHLLPSCYVPTVRGKNRQSLLYLPQLVRVLIVMGWDCYLLEI